MANGEPEHSEATIGHSAFIPEKDWIDWGALSALTEGFVEQHAGGDGDV